MADQLLSETDNVADAMRGMPGLTENAPKVISPAMHGALDYGVATTYLVLGMRLASRHPRASTLAFINGAMVLGLALMTDYPAGVWRRISFKTHRSVDMMQAALAGLGPVVMGFRNDPEAAYFYGQAASEVGVIAATDWDAVTT